MYGTLYVICHNYHFPLDTHSLRECGSTLLTGYNGTLAAGRYPDNYRTLFCEWTVQVAVNMVRFNNLTELGWYSLQYV